MKNQLLFGAIAASAMTMGAMTLAPEAQALTLTASISDFCNATNFTGTTACEGPYAGNDSVGEVNTAPGLFGFEDWTLAGKLDSQSGTQANLITVGSPSAGGWQTWAFHGTFDPTQYADLAFVVKGGTGFIGYLWDGVATSGQFKTLGLLNGGGNTPNLSHLTIYRRGTNNPPVDVPTPAAVLPILGGLFGAASRRKKGESTEA